MMTALDPLTTREPPHNFEAEQALLGTLLIHNGGWSSASEILQAEHFADPLHGRLFTMIGRLVERGQVVSAFTLKTYAEADEGLKAAGGPAYLARLMASSSMVSDVRSIATVVRDCALRRRLITVLSEALPQAYDEAQETTPAEQIEAIEQQLYAVVEGSGGGDFQPLNKALTGAIAMAEAAYKRPGGMSGVSTGLRDLDALLGGLHPSDLVILAARPSMGKSALASNIAFAVAQSGVPVGFFSLEMSAEQLATRLVAEQAGVSSERVRKGELNAAEFDRVLEASQRLEAVPLYMDDSAALSTAAIRTRARRLKRQSGLGLVVVDYLQLVDADRRRREQNRVQEVSEITRGLKMLAKELDVPVLALSQLSRAVENRADKRPQLADLRDSGTIEQDADVVMFIYREEYYLERGSEDDRARLGEVAGQAEVHVAKQRHGPTGLVRLRFDGHITKFSDVDRSNV